MTEPAYYAEGLVVHKRPIRRPIPGGAEITAGFPVCTVTDFVGEEGAVTIAAVLSLNEALARADEPEDACIACAVPFKEGDLVLGDAGGGEIHAACCGPE